MRPTTFLPLLLTGLPLASAQAPFATEGALPADFMTPDQVVHDVRGDEAWAMGADWKASFGPDGARYIPFLGSAAPQNFPVDLRLAEATLGGRPIPLTEKASVSRVGNTIDLDRGGVIVRYHLGLDSIEQTFVLADVPGELDGDLVVRVQAQSELNLENEGAGMRFAGELGGVRFGEATVLDSAGRSLAVESTRGEAEISIRVPQDFLTSAVWPVVVDPIITTYGVAETHVETWTGDVAYDATSDRFFHAYIRVWSNFDYDVLSVLSDGAGGFSDAAWIDLTDEWWTEVSAAADAGSQSFLVASHLAGPGTTAIRGRIRSLLTGVGPSFQISTPNLDAWWPHVGGDGNLDAPGGFIVGWIEDQQLWDALRYRIVDADGNMDPIQTLDTGHNFAITAPRIAKTNGNGLPGERRWNMVWTVEEEDEHMVYDIRGAQVALNGTVVTPPFNVDSTSDNSMNPVVAPPLDSASGGPRDFLAVYSSKSPLEEYSDIKARLFKEDDYVATYDITALEAEAVGSDAWVARGQAGPKIAVDGTQIVVGYSDWVVNAPNELYLSTFRLLDKELIPTEARVLLHAGEYYGEDLRLASSHQYGDLGSRRVLASYSTHVTDDDSDTYAVIYETPAGFDFLGTTVCAGMPNSTGYASTLRAYGSDDPDDNRLWLDVDNLPHFQTGMFIMSSSSSVTPLGQGFLCLGAPVVRLTSTVDNSWVQGAHGVQLDLPNLPAAGMITAGETWYFQYWHRDVGGNFNFSNALEIPFQ